MAIATGRVLFRRIEVALEHVEQALEDWRMVRAEDGTALIQKAVEGNAPALKLLLTQTRGRLCRYLAPRIPADLKRMVDVDDVVQETHVEVFRRIHAFPARDDESFFRWLAAIALSRLRNAIKWHRAAKRRGPRRPDGQLPHLAEDTAVALLTMLASPGPTPSRPIRRAEAATAVHAAIAELPERHQRAVWLVYIEGQTVRDAAARLNCTERAVHGLCRRGLKTLQQKLNAGSHLTWAG